jgi:hypothetical protein
MAGEGAHKFLNLSMEGARFELLGMPVSALAEIVALSDLLEDLARHLFLRANPNRERVPKGFRDRFDLRLTAVDEGSARPVLEREPFGQLTIDGDEFDAAGDLLVRGIQEFAKSNTLPEEFPATSVAKFGRFGRSFRAGDRFVLSRDGTGDAAYYTPRIRQALLLTSSDRYTAVAEAHGRITELDQDTLSFQLRVSDELRVPCKISDDLLQSAYELSDPNDLAEVRVEGVGVYSATGGLIRFDEITDLSLDSELTDNPAALQSAIEARALESALGRRIQELAGLQPNWMGPGSEPPTGSALRTGRQLLAVLNLGSGIALVPTYSGGLQFEWTAGRVEQSIEVEPSGALYLHAANVDADVSEATELSMVEVDTEIVQTFLQDGSLP